MASFAYGSRPSEEELDRIVAEEQMRLAPWERPAKINEALGWGRVRDPKQAAKDVGAMEIGGDTSSDGAIAVMVTNTVDKSKAGMPWRPWLASWLRDPEAKPEELTLIALAAHRATGHGGAQKTAQLVRQAAQSPLRGAERRAAREAVAHCWGCLLQRSRLPKAQPLPEATGRFGDRSEVGETILIDHYTGISCADGDIKVLSAVDDCSRFMDFAVVKSTSATDAIIALEQVLSGWPGSVHRVVSDNGPAFVADEFEAWAKARGLQLVKTAPNHGQSLARLERLHNLWSRSIGSAIVDRHRGLDEWRTVDVVRRLGEAVRAHNRVTNWATGVEPEVVFYGRPTATDEELRAAQAERLAAWRQHREDARRERERAAAGGQEPEAQAKTVRPVPGELVLLRTPQEERVKFDPRWKGPRMVVGRSGSHRLLLENGDGEPQVVHVDVVGLLPEGAANNVDSVPDDGRCGRWVVEDVVAVRRLGRWPLVEVAWAGLDPDGEPWQNTVEPAAFILEATVWAPKVRRMLADAREARKQQPRDARGRRRKATAKRGNGRRLARESVARRSRRSHRGKRA